MNLFRFLLRASWRSVVLAVLVGAVSGVGSIGLIVLIHTTLRRPSPATGNLVVGFVGLCIVVLVTRIISQVLLVRLSQGAVSRLCLHLSRRILDVPLRRLEEIGPHRLTTALTSDVLVIAQALNGAPVLVVNAAILACGLAYLGWLAPSVLVAVVIFLVLGVASYRLSAAQAAIHLKRAREQQDTLMRHLRSLIDGVKELKIHRDRREAFLDRELTSADAALRAHQTTGLTVQAATVSSGRLLFFVVIGLLLFVLPRVKPITSATLSGYTLTILYLMAPVEGIMAWFPVLSRARISLRKVEELGLSLQENEPAGPPSLPTSTWERLELVGVTHAYRRERDESGFLLGPIDLSLRPGELVFVVGGNGSGKTTLVKLVTGLYSPEAGEIRVDGRPVASEDFEAYRQRFSVVFADVVLFDGLLGIDAPELDDRARDYLEQLQLDHKVEVRQGAFSTTDLSKGQRKRLALLTAYFEDRPIYVFDEWAADQDPSFKDVFYHRILPELKARGKAVLVVTHDERYFSVADRIVTLCDGQMTQGSWEHDRVALDGALAGPA